MTIRSDPHNPNTLSYRFMQQAMEIWHQEHDNATLTTIQGGLVLSEVISIDGMDNLGWMLYQTCVSLLKRLLAEREEASKASLKGKAPDRSTGNSTDKMERAIQATTWSVFRLSCRPLMDIPNMPLYENAIPSPDNSEPPTQENWRPYPYTQPAEPNRTREGTRVFSELSRISYKFSDLETTATKEVRPVALDDKLNLYKEIEEWKNSIPEGLKMSDNSVFTATAHIVCAHLLIEIHNAPLDSSAVATKDPEKLSDFLQMSKRLALEAELAMYEVLERFEGKYSLEMLPEPMLVGPVIASKLAMEAFISSTTPQPSKDNTTSTGATEIPAESAPKRQVDSSKYEKLFNMLCTLSEQFWSMKMYARALQLSAKKLGIPIGLKTQSRLQRLFEGGEAERSQWIKEITTLQTRLTLAFDHVENNVGDVLNELENLSI
ncbi:hypothetical protein AA313_de0209165 [Arthrobotrys entomopaga]|nr:hypothetical protein AA313_de0209165 [Arthrobotrys entomopaga]